MTFDVIIVKNFLTANFQFINNGHFSLDMFVPDALLKCVVL